MSESNNANRETRILIMGAGMSGMLMAIRLLQAGITDFEILEKGNAPGGTWRCCNVQHNGFYRRLIPAIQNCPKPY